MNWNARAIRTKRTDKLLKSRKRRNIIASGSGGCPISFIINTATPFGVGTNFIHIPVSGLPTPLFSGLLVSCTVNITHPSLQELDVIILEPTLSAGSFFTQTTVGATGANFINTTLNISSTTLITSSTAPYTGNFDDEQYSGFGFDSMNGYASNGDWVLDIENYGVTSGTLNSIKLTFNPCATPTCPTINIGVLNFAGGAIPTVGVAIQGGAQITGGSPSYTLVGTTGDVPDGMSVGVVPFSGNWFVGLSGIPTTFGTYIFTVNIKDANGCPGSQEFTVLVGAKFAFDGGPLAIGAGGAEAVVNVSGLPLTYGVGVKLYSVKIGITRTINATISGNIYAPGGLAYQVFGQLDLSGSNLTNTYIIMEQPLITSGSAPYTGNFAGVDLNEFDQVFHHADMNDQWSLLVTPSIPAAAGGTIDIVEFLFIPI